MITVHYKSDFDYFFTKKYYMTAVILTAVLCFGYSATHVTVGGDTLKGDLYLGDGNIMLAAVELAWFCGPSCWDTTMQKRSINRVLFSSVF